MKRGRFGKVIRGDGSSGIRCADRFGRRFGFCRLGIDEIATHRAEDCMTAMAFFVRSRKWFPGTAGAGNAHRNGPSVEKGAHRGRQPWRLLLPAGVFGASDREQKSRRFRTRRVPINYHLFPSVGCRADANQRFVILLFIPTFSHGLLL
jgi:hypothetical protein